MITNTFSLPLLSFASLINETLPQFCEVIDIRQDYRFLIHDQDSIYAQELDGEWSLSIDPTDVGRTEEWFKGSLPEAKLAGVRFSASAT